MIEAVVRWLIGLCLLVLAAVLIIWVFGALGIIIPAMAIKIIWIVIALIAILLLVRLLRPYSGEWLP